VESVVTVMDHDPTHSPARHKVPVMNVNQLTFIIQYILHTSI